MAGDSWRNPTAGARFVAERAARVPETEAQLATLVHLLGVRALPVRRVVDLGSGGGLLLATILAAFPAAEGVAIDFAPEMLALARERLADFGPRAQVLAGDLRDDGWRAAAAGPGGAPADTVVSGLAIHHLPDARKRALYGEVLASLAPGGSFLQLDLVAGTTPATEAWQHEAMVVHRHRSRLAAGESTSLAAVRDEYWGRPERADDILAPLAEQCRWLRELGFVEVDCFWKWFGIAIFGGERACS